MTVPTTTSKITAAGNDTATVFSFSPMVLPESSADLTVVFVAADGVETDLTEGVGTSNYSVTVASYPGTGSITYPASGAGKLATGQSLVMKRVLELTQSTALDNQGGYFADVQEAAFDRQMMVAIQQQEELDRTIKAPIGSSTVPDDLMAELAADVVAAAASATASAGSATASAGSATSSATAATASQTAQAAAEAAAAGMKWRPSVRVATTANITLSAAQTIDGISVVAGDRVLVKDQSTPAQNGVYVCASGAWSRAVDADSWIELVSQVVAVEVGTANADYTFICTVDQGGTLGSTAVAWTTFKVTLPDGSLAFVKIASAAIAAQADAEAGSSNVLLMTPIRVAQAIAALGGVKFARYTYQEATTVAGETYAASAWRIIGLNTEVQDLSNIGAIASKRIVLAAGTYILKASLVISYSNTTAPQLRIYNNTQSTQVAFANASGGGNAVGTQVGGYVSLECQYVSNGTDALEMDVYPGGQATVAPQPSSSGNAEVYAQFMATKIA